MASALWIIRGNGFVSRSITDMRPHKHVNREDPLGKSQEIRNLSRRYKERRS